MLCPSSNVRIVVPTPVSISIVVICDTRILIHDLSENDSDKKYCFPYDYLSSGVKSAQEMASLILSDICDFDHCSTKWTPVDIRSDPKRKNPDGIYTLDIGYMAIIDTHDMPHTKDNSYVWKQLNLEERKFPAILTSDHNSLWDASFDIFSLIR